MPVPLSQATEPSDASVIDAHCGSPSTIARRRSIIVAEVSVHLPLPLCMRKTSSSFIVAASALIAIAGSIVSTSASTSSMLSNRFFIRLVFFPPVFLPVAVPRKTGHNSVIINHRPLSIKEFKRKFTFLVTHWGSTDTFIAGARYRGCGGNRGEPLAVSS